MLLQVGKYLILFVLGIAVLVFSSIFGLLLIPFILIMWIIQIGERTFTKIFC